MSQEPEITTWRNTVSAITDTKTITVDGVAQKFNFSIDPTVRSVQWHDGEGVVEYKAGYTTPLAGQEDYDTHVLPYVVAWEENVAKQPSWLDVNKSKKYTLLDRDFTIMTESSKTSFTTSFGVTINGNRIAKANVDGLVQKMDAEGTETLYFMDFYNVGHDLTAEQMHKMQIELVDFGNEMYTKKWTIRTMIEACQDIACVENISWDENLNVVEALP